MWYEGHISDELYKEFQEILKVNNHCFIQCFRGCNKEVESEELKFNDCLYCNVKIAQ